jgi:hypothetical protein
MEIRITNPKLAANWLVKTAVWVKKPGPIADVAIKKAAPSKAECFIFFIFEKAVL